MTVVWGGDSSGSTSWIGTVSGDEVAGDRVTGEGVGGCGESGKGMVSVSPSIFCGGFYRYLHSWAQSVVGGIRGGDSHAGYGVALS